MIRASTTTARSGRAASGLTSISEIDSPRSSARAERPITAPTMASMSAGALPRAPFNSAAPRRPIKALRTASRCGWNRQHRHVFEHFDEDAACTECEHRAELGIVDDAEDQLGSLRDHLLDENLPAQSLFEVRVGFGEFFAIRDPEANAISLCLVEISASLERNGITDLVACTQCLRERSGLDLSRRGEPVGGEELLAVVLAECARSAAKTLAQLRKVCRARDLTGLLFCIGGRSRW